MSLLRFGILFLEVPASDCDIQRMISWASSCSGFSRNELNELFSLVVLYSLRCFLLRDTFSERRQ
jgi:hypothetical protein